MGSLTGTGVVTKEAWHPIQVCLEVLTKEVIQGRHWCEVADEPVVVIKARPMKAGNSVEDKTEQIISIVSDEAQHCQKRAELRRGEVIFKTLERNSR